MTYIPPGGIITLQHPRRGSYWRGRIVIHYERNPPANEIREHKLRAAGQRGREPRRRTWLRALAPACSTATSAWGSGCTDEGWSSAIDWRPRHHACGGPKPSTGCVGASSALSPRLRSSAVDDGVQMVTASAETTQVAIRFYLARISLDQIHAARGETGYQVEP